MVKDKDQDKARKVFLVVTPNDAKRKFFEDIIDERISMAVVHSAPDGASGMNRIENVPPHVIVCDFDLPKLSGKNLVTAVLEKKKMASTSFIFASYPPEDEIYIDELVTGRIQFLHKDKDEAEFNACLAKALNFSFTGQGASYSLRFLVKGDQLIREGDVAKSVYIVKKGRLRAYRLLAGVEIELGYVEIGEFVGEMAYINGEPRAANVEALTDCELIEVPIGTLDQILYRRPAWCKTLMHTLARRLKQANRRTN